MESLPGALSHGWQRKTPSGLVASKGKGEPAGPAQPLPGAATSVELTGHTLSAHTPSLLSPGLSLP